MDWSIQEIARRAGTTSRTLRHYDAVGLLTPTRLAPNGYRHYDERALVRLQRILLLRELGLGLEQIGEILDRPHDEAHALRAHVAWLQQEQQRLTRQIRAVEHTLNALTQGEDLMPDTMFEGFDTAQHREEVQRRWGTDTYALGEQWWSAKTATEKADFQAIVAELQRDWIALAAAETDPASTEAQTLAARHIAWLRSVPGIPEDFPGYVRGLAAMYVEDLRFAAHYDITPTEGGPRNNEVDTRGAEFVRDALLISVDSGL